MSSPSTAPAPTISVDSCLKFVEAGKATCQPVTASTVAPDKSPNFDGVATSLSALSAAFAWGSIVLAIVALLVAAGWGWVVKRWAEKVAQTEARECAKAQIDKWLAEEAPQILARQAELLQNASLGQTDDAIAADNIGEEAG